MHIRYNHRSTQLADTQPQALDLIRTEAIHVKGDARVFDLYVRISCEDGDYVYLSQADADLDEDGSRAFAVIDNGSHEDSENE